MRLFFFSQIRVFSERFRGLYTGKKHTEDELSAGVEKFNAYGAFGTLDFLADGDVLKYDDILKQSANVVYTKLMLSKDKREYQENLDKIREERHKSKTGGRR